MSVVIIQHGRFQHGHGRMDGRGLGTGSAHLDDAATRAGDIGVFLAQLAVGIYLNFILAAGKFTKNFTELAHAKGFRFPVGFHACNLDDNLLVSRKTGDCGHAKQQATRH